MDNECLPGYEELAGDLSTKLVGFKGRLAWYVGKDGGTGLGIALNRLTGTWNFLQSAISNSVMIFPNY